MIIFLGFLFLFLESILYLNVSYWTTVTVFILAVHHMIGCRVFPPDEFVKQVIETRDEAELSQHFVDLQEKTMKQ